MTQEAKDILKNIPATRCSVCNKPRSYTNPIEKCWECKKPFCFSHIWGGQIKSGTKVNEQLRDICKSCRVEHGYTSL